MTISSLQPSTNPPFIIGAIAILTALMPRRTAPRDAAAHLAAAQRAAHARARVDALLR